MLCQLKANDFIYATNWFMLFLFPFAESASKYEVFLGGSCNPTTWRQEVAIPILKNLGITYYNPVRHLQISFFD